jgi:hypothetical protein
MSARIWVLTALPIIVASAWLAPEAHAGLRSDPTGRQLLVSMKTALHVAGSAHITVSTAHSGARVAAQTISRTTIGHMDISLRTLRMHTVVVSRTRATKSYTVVVAQRTEVIGVNYRMAERDNGGAWICDTVAPADAAKAYDLLSYFPLPSHPRSVKNVGVGTLRGTKVWHVNIDLGTWNVVLNIDQSSDLLLRESLTPRQPVSPPTYRPGTTYLDYSKYGEVVDAHLPVKCR